MKKITLYFAIVFLMPISIFAQEKSVDNSNTIILVNPGVFYLKSLNLLVEKSIINIDDLNFKAVFYNKSEVSILEAKQYVEDSNILNISFVEVDGELNADNLYETNSCTDSYKELFNTSKGVIFLGGWDIPPVTYNSKTSLHTEIRTPNRHYFELSFLYHLLGNGEESLVEPLLKLDPDYVVYGICLGMQSMSVAAGGNMYQDIPSEVYGANTVEDVLVLDDNKLHRSYWKNIDRDSTLGSHSFHQIKFEKNSYFTKNYGLENKSTPYVCSSHHQAIKKVGYGFDVIATSIDGRIIEAIKHKEFKNVLGVQFHPEFYYLHDSESKKIKQKSTDTGLRTEYEIINDLGGYPFTLSYWSNFSKLFK